MDALRDPYRVDSTIRVAAMILDQLVDPGPGAFPGLGRGGRAAELDDKESNSHVLLYGYRELLEVPLPTLPKTTVAALVSSVKYIYIDINSRLAIDP